MPLNDKGDAGAMEWEERDRGRGNREGGRQYERE